MTSQPQPPERRPLNRADDPATVIRDAEVAHGFGRDGTLAAETRRFLEGLHASGIPHVLVGALAMLQHVEGRTTRDIDLIVATADVEKLNGFEMEERNEWFATGTVGPLRVDLLFTENPLFAEILRDHAEPCRLLGVPIRCATPEGIVLLKLFALPSLYRQGNVQRAALYETDILQLEAHQPHETDALLQQLEPHVGTSDLAALREVLTDIRHRLDRAEWF